MGDLPDYHQYVSQVSVEIPEGEESVSIFRPKGGILEEGNVTTTASFVTVASRTVTDDLQFQLAKLMVSAEYSTWIRLKWNGAQIGEDRLIDDRTVLIEHFPWDYYTMVGDGSKLFEVQVKYYETAGKCHAEIVGEEV